MKNFILGFMVCLAIGFAVLSGVYRLFTDALAKNKTTQKTEQTTQKTEESKRKDMPNCSELPEQIVREANCTIVYSKRESTGINYMFLCPGLSEDGGDSRVDMVISFEGLSNDYKADKYEHLSDCLMKWKDGTMDVLYVLGKGG